MDAVPRQSLRREVNRVFIKPPVNRFGIKYFNNFTQRKTLLRGIFHSTGSDVHFPSKILREFFIEIRIYYLGEFRKLYAKVCFWKLNISEEKVFIIYLQVWDLQEFWNSVNARGRGIYVQFHLKENKFTQEFWFYGERRPFSFKRT